MKRLSLVLLCVSLLTACRATPPVLEDPEALSEARTEDPLEGLETRLGMRRSPEDLGFAEMRFNTCEHGLSPTTHCKQNYLTIVQFQLLCRNSEGTVQNVPMELNPIVSNRVEWKLGPRSGGTATDVNGYGRVALLSERPVRGQRLTLRIGKQFVGFTASDVSKIVLPRNFCSTQFAGILSA